MLWVDAVRTVADVTYAQTFWYITIGSYPSHAMCWDRLAINFGFGVSILLWVKPASAVYDNSTF